MSDQLYHTILADPPWNERGGGKIQRGANRHYPLMSDQEIFDLGVPTPQTSCARLPPLLVGDKHFPPCWFEALKAWGFRYVTVITWFKDRIGLGQYFRGTTEHMLFAVRGTSMLPLPCDRQTTAIRDKFGLPTNV